jgi:hypothetical protein
MHSADDDEPYDVLWTGSRVLRAVLWLTRYLQRSGHLITVDPDTTRVKVLPPVHDEALSVLDCRWRDTQAILEAEGFVAERLLAAPRHQADTLWTVH